jgi:hypothetical protein
MQVAVPNVQCLLHSTILCADAVSISEAQNKLRLCWDDNVLVAGAQTSLTAIELGLTINAFAQMQA